MDKSRSMDLEPFVKVTRRFDYEINNLYFKIYYDVREWKEDPILHNGEHTIMLCGWFILNGKKNDLRSLLERITNIGLAEALNEITLGVFIGLYRCGKNSYLFNDYLSLSHHFIRQKVDGSLQISPAINGFDSQALNRSEEMDDFISKNRYIYGDKTAYAKINRFPPGSILNVRQGNATRYFKLKDENLVEIEKIPSIIKEVVECWDKEERSLAVTSGFDSRLIYTQSDFKFIYTWGPCNSYDRKISKKLYDYKNDKDSNYRGISFLRSAAEDLLEWNKFMLDGSMEPFDSNFIANYYYIGAESFTSHAAFDGYLGDVLQKGTFLFPKGTIGEIYKVFPWLFRYMKLDPESLLRRKYGITSKEHEVLQLFKSFEEEYKLSNVYSRLTLFEIMYGQGAKLTVNGCLLINGLFKIAVPVFMDRRILETLLATNWHDTLEHKTIKKIWKTVSIFEKKQMCESFYSVRTPSIIFPFVKVVGRFLNNKIPYFYNYGKESKLK